MPGPGPSQAEHLSKADLCTFGVDEHFFSDERSQFWWMSSGSFLNNRRQEYFIMPFLPSAVIENTYSDVSPVWKEIFNAP
jgi:hypothetical protein